MSDVLLWQEEVIKELQNLQVVNGHIDFKDLEAAMLKRHRALLLLGQTKEQIKQNIIEVLDYLDVELVNESENYSL
jgi:hypothetical protein